MRVLRAARGVGLTELARRAGVSPSTLSKLERGKTRRNWAETAKKVAAALEVPTDALFDLHALLEALEAILTREEEQS